MSIENSPGSSCELTISVNYPVIGVMLANHKNNLKEAIVLGELATGPDETMDPNDLLDI